MVRRELTNFNTVKKSIEKLENLNSELIEYLRDSMTKKEALVEKNRSQN
ncbi:MAG: hypothetical protein CM15mP63_0980 [Gammaproteobacteria bacterium]|nr:MAG: hypothetical protein CM15mP63_0980 [Gammaproteobacteria bacterium]